uniref:F-box/LRR-repeat protein n=1 Tax=Rhizophora mucronata TaxID=61149 RepID=A0A2P2NJV4_RHIMU
MDSVLSDELLQEIFTRVSKSPSSSSSSLSICLVSKRWLRLYRTSKISLSLRLTLGNSTIPSLSSLLSQYPFLSSLHLLISSDPTITPTSTTMNFNDSLLFVVSCYCSKLKHLRYLGGPASVPSLRSLSNSCSLLTSLAISVSRPLFFNWVVSFSCLKELSIYLCDSSCVEDDFYCKGESGLLLTEELDAELGLQSLSLSGIRRDDFGVGWLWRSCKKLNKLRLKRCEGIGDGRSLLSFIRCLQGLEEVELRTCRGIVDGILLKLAENCHSLNSLLVYDGGSREGLLQFISNSRCNLQTLDLRLPLDLENVHLSAVSVHFRGLSTLRLQSCCLVTGDGLKAIGIAVSSGLEELALVNCDVVERESGLLATLGQNLKQLKKLDLSYNDFLLDKELTSMLVSFTYLTELKLRGCKSLTNATLLSVSKSCKRLESVDVMHCCGIGAEAVEMLVLSLPRLRCLQVECNKLSEVARTWASYRLIEVVA